MADIENTDSGKSGSSDFVVSRKKNTADDVKAITPDVAYWRERTSLPFALMEGTYGMKAAGNSFLPQHTIESDTAYNRRLARSTLLNAFRKTTSFLAGQIFQSDIVFDESVPQEFLEWNNEIDVKGNNINVFAKRVFQFGIAEGVRAIFIDMPPKDPDVTTRADEQEAGIRPYFKEVSGKDIIAGIVDQDGFLVQVRIQETITERLGRYGTKTVKQIRVLEPGKYEVHQEGTAGEMSIVESGEYELDYIPIVFFIPGEEWSIITGETPLMDLAELNGKHWRSSSDQDNILSVARVPILFGKNIEVAQMPVGVATMVTSTDDAADMKYIEVTGAAINAGQKDLDEIEAAMALYGLQQLVPRTGNMTATEKAITSSESNSSLGTWATEFETVLTAAYEVAGDMVGIEFPDNAITVNKEFSFGVADPQELAQILAAHDQGIISAQATFSEFRRRGVFDEHLSWDDMEADLEQEQRQNTTLGGLAGSIFGQPNTQNLAGDNQET